MDIEEFIEQDIIQFLDARIDADTKENPDIVGEEVAFLTRDYEKEFLGALDQSNIAQAKRVLHDLKAKFDEFPHGTPEKQQLKFLLTDLYEKFKDYLDAESTFSRMEAGLSGRSIESPVPAAQGSQQTKATPALPPVAPLASIEKTATQGHGKPPASEPSLERPIPHIERTPAPTIPAAQPSRQIAPEQRRAPQEPLPEAVPEQDIAAHAMSTLDRVDASVSRGNLRQAVDEYRLARRDVLSLSAVPPALAKRFTAVFATIGTALRKEKDAKHTATATDAALHSVAQEPARTKAHLVDGTAVRRPDKCAVLDRHLLLQLEREKHALDGQLRNNDFGGSMRTYKRMRLLVTQLHDKAKAESAAQKLIQIHRILRQASSHADDHTLTRKVP